MKKNSTDKNKSFLTKTLSSKFYFVFWAGTIFNFFILTYLFKVFNQEFQNNTESFFYSFFTIFYILNIVGGIVTFIFSLVTYFIEKINSYNAKRQSNKVLNKKNIQELNKKMLNKIKRFFYFWIGTIILFYLLVFSVNGDFSTAPYIYVVLFLFNIIGGVIFFLTLLYLIIKNKFWDWLALTMFIFVVFFIILPMLPNRNSNQISAGDPFVDCPINEKCGGGTKRLKQSECINSTCCQIGDVWVVLDKDQCKLKQQEYSKNNQPVYYQKPQIKIPEIEPPICCRQTCNSFTGVCTTKCERSYFCF
jgi:hypothetical protein